MSGLVGYIGHRAASPIILDALGRLEYRGYDSAGIAVINGKSLKTVKTLGRPAKLSEKLKTKKLPGTLGIGHTRWASHGKPSIRNAHPMVADSTAVVHNGILDGAAALKESLTKKGLVFHSETDTEILPNLVNLHWKGSLVESVLEALKGLEGGLTCCVISSRDPEQLVAVRKGNPMVIGFGEMEYIAASDATAIAPYTDRMVFLQDGELAVLSQEGVQFYGFDGKLLEHEPQKISWNPVMAEKRGYRHFFLKEIIESPRALRETIDSCFPVKSEKKATDDDFVFPCNISNEFTRVLFYGGGLSYAAALLGQWIFESIAGIATSRRPSSEMQYGIGIVEKDTLYVAISQSGETLDTLEASRFVQERGGRVLAITNNASSSLARLADEAFITQAGPEVSVASSKTFSAAVMGLILLAFQINRASGYMKADDRQKLIEEVLGLPEKMELVIKHEEKLKRLAVEFMQHRSFFFVGRSLHYPVAYYAAYLMKQVANIHAEGLIAGEIKHGPISLVEKGTPVMFFANQEALKKQVINDMDELRARGAAMIATGFQDGSDIAERCDHFISVPKTPDYLSPLLAIVPAQLFIYYVALNNRKDIDRPRNIAKSVTV